MAKFIEVNLRGRMISINSDYIETIHPENENQTYICLSRKLEELGNTRVVVDNKYSYIRSQLLS